MEAAFFIFGKIFTVSKEINPYLKMRISIKNRANNFFHNLVKKSLFIFYYGE
jgi:hypothetical protein